MRALLSRSVAAFALAGFLLAPMESRAGFVEYPNRIAFDGAAGATANVETWDSFATGHMFLPNTVTNGIEYDASNGNAIVTPFSATTTPPNGLGRSGLFYFNAGESITFTYDAPMFGFGIDISTIELNDGSFSATTDVGDVVLSVFDPFPSNSQIGQFVGFTTSIAFTSVTIAGLSQSTYTLDTMRFLPESLVVPEPATISLIGLAILVTGTARRQSADR